MHPSDKPVAWITGAAGLIGHHLVETAPRYAPAWDIVGLTRSTLDLTDHSAVRSKFLNDSPALIIHCAALSKSPACQKDPDRAWKVNFEATRRLAELACEISFVFFSSDMVFDGRRGNYNESDSPNPLNVYAETKVAAERVVLNHPAHTIIRASLNAGISITGDRAFNEEMVNDWRRGKTLTLFVDEFRCPIPAAATARAVWELVTQGSRGLFHLGGSERLSRYEIGELLANAHRELNPMIQRGSLQDYRGAPRSPDLSLDCRKIQSIISFGLPRFSDFIRPGLQ